MLSQVLSGYSPRMSPLSNRSRIRQSTRRVLRRTLSRGRVILVTCVCTLVAGCGEPPPAPGGFEVMETSISQLNLALESGEVTSEALVRLYLQRIAAFDQAGPSLNAVIAVSPDAIAEAAQLDIERGEGRVRGPLHGIPVLVKDNYDTANMPTTAGTVGLATSMPPDDAFQVRKLREAGAIILGKTNMHELARGITTVSSLTGQTRNPYDPSRNPGGSSGGTGAAIAASFAAVGMGSDTCGSIRIPSAHHALVGLRGTRGLASGDGIIPLSTTQDIGGPLARTVEDLAVTLDATVGYDPADPVTELSGGNIPSTYTESLDPDSLQTARLGVVVALMGTAGAEQPVRDVVALAIEEMTGLGAVVVEIEEPDLSEMLEDVSVIVQEFSFDFDAYLSRTPDAAIRSLRQLVELGLYHDIIDQGVRRSLEVESLDTDDYRTRIAKRDDVRAAVLAVMDEHQLDALLYPTIRQTARPVGQPQPGSNCALSALSGLPAITMPGGFADDGMPVGVELLGRAFSESRLIGLAYAFEQATGHRTPPEFTPSLVTPVVPVDLDIVVTSSPADTISGRARFRFDPATRRLEYSISAYGVRDDDVLAIDVHTSEGGATSPARGPSLRRIGRHRARATGRFVMTGREVRLLREGMLYVDVHTVTDVTGALRIDLRLPTPAPESAQ